MHSVRTIDCTFIRRMSLYLPPHTPFALSERSAGYSKEEGAHVWPTPTKTIGWPVS